MTLRIDVRPGYLHAVLTGPFVFAQAQEEFREVVEAAARHKAPKVLIDGRGITSAPDVRERYQYGRFIAETVEEFRPQGVDPMTRFAYVLLPPVLDKDRLGEGIASFWGMNVKVFETLEDAAQWLGVPILVRSRPATPE